jgi:hypothetical protein
MFQFFRLATKAQYGHGLAGTAGKHPQPPQKSKSQAQSDQRQDKKKHLHNSPLLFPLYGKRDRVVPIVIVYNMRAVFATKKEPLKSGSFRYIFFVPWGTTWETRR